MRRKLLILGACGSFVVAGLHILLGTWMLLIPSHAPALCRFFGGGTTGNSAVSAVALGAFALAAIFVAFAFYGLAAAGRFRVLPLLRPVAMVIGIIYLLRGLALFPALYSFAFGPGTVPLQQLGFSAISLTIGLLHLVGLCRGGKGAPGSRSVQT